MRPLSMLPATRPLTAIAVTASSVAHGAGLLALIALYDPAPAVPEMQPVTIEFVAASSTMLAGQAGPESRPENTLEPTKVEESDQSPMPVSEELRENPRIPEQLELELQVEHAERSASDAIDAEPVELAEQGSTEFELEIVALPRHVEFSPTPNLKPHPPAPAEKVQTAEEPTQPSLSVTEATESLDGAQLPPTRPAAKTVNQAGDRGESETASLEQEGEGFVAADHSSELSRNKPRYPRRAILKAQQGRVVLAVQIAASGAVQSVEVIQSSGHLILDRAATKTVSKWKVVPARRGGLPVASEKEISITFRLEDR